MKDLETKKKVLSEIMELMEEKDGDMLKMHPKVMAAKIEVGKPESEDPMEKIKEKMSPSEEDSESPEMESEEEMSPEMIQKMLEMYKDMK